MLISPRFFYVPCNAVKWRPFPTRDLPSLRKQTHFLERVEIICAQFFDAAVECSDNLIRMVVGVVAPRMF